MVPACHAGPTFSHASPRTRRTAPKTQMPPRAAATWRVRGIPNGWLVINGINGDYIYISGWWFNGKLMGFQIGSKMVV